MQSVNQHVEPGFLRLKQVLEIIPVGKSSFWAGVRAGKYPKPIKLGPRTTVWRREEIFAFVANAGTVGSTEQANPVKRKRAEERPASLSQGG